MRLKHEHPYMEVERNRSGASGYSRENLCRSELENAKPGTSPRNVT